MGNVVSLAATTALPAWGKALWNLKVQTLLPADQNESWVMIKCRKISANLQRILGNINIKEWGIKLLVVRGAYLLFKRAETVWFDML